MIASNHIRGSRYGKASWGFVAVRQSKRFRYGKPDRGRII